MSRDEESSGCERDGVIARKMATEAGELAVDEIGVKVDLGGGGGFEDIEHSRMIWIASRGCCIPLVEVFAGHCGVAIFLSLVTLPELFAKLDFRVVSRFFFFLFSVMPGNRISVF